MNKIRFQQFLIGILLISNILLLVFGFLLRRPPHDPEGPKRMVIERLHFDEAQVKQYETKIAWHRTNVDAKNKQIRQLKTKLYSFLKSDEDHPQYQMLIKEIGSVQMEIEDIHYRHFLQIRSICRKDQIKDFDKLAGEMTDVFRMGGRPPGK